MSTSAAGGGPGPGPNFQFRVRLVPEMPGGQRRSKQGPSSLALTATAVQGSCRRRTGSGERLAAALSQPPTHHLP